MIFIKKLKTLLIIAAATALVCTAALLIINGIVKHSVRPYILTDSEVSGGFDCILILGCGVYGDRPSHMLEDRLLTGTALYPAAAPKLLMSGDNQSPDYDEVSAMVALAVRLGESEDGIQTDRLGLSTYESVARARAQHEGKRILIVTQRYHLYRALYIAEQMGFDAFGVSADVRSYRGQSLREVREVLARCKDFLKVLMD